MDPDHTTPSKSRLEIKQRQNIESRFASTAFLRSPNSRLVKRSDAPSSLGFWVLGSKLRMEVISSPKIDARRPWVGHTNTSRMPPLREISFGVTLPGLISQFLQPFDEIERVHLIAYPDAFHACGQHQVPAFAASGLNGGHHDGASDVGSDRNLATKAIGTGYRVVR